MKLIVLITVMGLLVFGVVSVSATVVEVIYEEPTGWNPFGHSAIRMGDKVYDVSKEGEGSGKTHIRERDWEDVLNDERGQQTAEVAMTDKQKQQLKENIESEEGSEFDYNFLTNNCADWVEDKLREIGVNIPDDNPDYPEDTLQQVLDLPPIVNGDVDSQGNEVTIDLGKVATSYADAFKGVTLSFNLPDQYTLSGEEKSDDCIKLYIQGPEVKAVGDEAWPSTKENVVIYYRDSFYIEIKIKSHQIHPGKPLTIDELSDYDRSPWGILVAGDCGGAFPETKITRISGHDAEYGMKWTYSYTKILTGGPTYVSVTYCGSPYADSKGYRYRQITTDKGEFWIESATIGDQRPEDRYLSDTKAITESIRINGWAFDNTIMVQGEPQESQIRTEISREGKEWNNKGDALYKSGDYENAIKAYDKAIEIDPMNYGAWHSKGSAFYQLGKYKEAIESYSKTLEINPYDMEAWYGKGILLYELGEYNKAVEAFDKVLEIDPENKKALESRKNVLGLIKNPFREHEEEEMRGFEVIFAIAGLFTVAYLLRRRK